MSELPKEIREAVAYTAQHWPKTLNAESLLRELDTLAQRVYVLASTSAFVASDDPSPLRLECPNCHGPWPHPLGAFACYYTEATATDHPETP